jgi:hypothetical protein
MGASLYPDNAAWITGKSNFSRPIRNIGFDYTARLHKRI